jgi:DNA-binding NarL/FixJ family response regulator
MKVIIAETDPKLKYAVTVLIREQPGWVVSASAGSLDQLIRLCGQDQPDVVIADLDLPGMDFPRLHTELADEIRWVILLASVPLSQNKADAVMPERFVFISKIESPEELVAIFGRIQQNGG